MNIKKWVLDTFAKLHINHVWFCEPCGQCHLSGALTSVNGKKVCPSCEREVKNITGTPLGNSYFAFIRPDLS